MVPAAPAASSSTTEAATPQCARSSLSAGFLHAGGTSVFVLSTIDNSCPGVLRGAQRLEPFTREQILRQLKQYGTPVITQEPRQYNIDGHRAAITMASVEEAAQPNKRAVTTYAAKACFLGNIPEKRSGKSGGDSETSHVLCFDFTTPQRDLLPRMLSFTLQFDKDAPQPLVPGNILR